MLTVKGLRTDVHGVPTSEQPLRSALCMHYHRQLSLLSHFTDEGMEAQVNEVFFFLREPKSCELKPDSRTLPFMLSCFLPKDTAASYCRTTPRIPSLERP